MERRLTRSESNRMFAGVCGGIAAYLNIDATIVRFAFILLALSGGMGVLSYIVLMLIMPTASHADLPANEIFQDNMNDLGKNMSDAVNRASENPNSALLAAGTLIFIGVYALLREIGVVSASLWPFLAPAVLIGIGVLVWRQRDS